MPLVGEVDANPTNSGQHPRSRRVYLGLPHRAGFRTDAAGQDTSLRRGSLGGRPRRGPGAVDRDAFLVVVKKCFSDAVAEGLIGASPALSVKPPRPDQIERRFLTLGELNRIEAAMVKRWRIVVPFAACTGLRIGELAALRTADLNLAAREVKVRATAV